jgi:hypothetical protein
MVDIQLIKKFSAFSKSEIYLLIWLREEHRLMLSEIRVLRRMFVPKRDEIM